MSTYQIAIDRRKGAPAPEPVHEPVSADNVYQVMHPDVAARIGAALGRAVREISPKDGRRSQSAEDHMAQFRERLKYMDLDQLDQLRTRVEDNNKGESYALPYLAAIDEQMKVTDELARV